MAHAALGVLAFSYAVEVSQAFHLVDHLGLGSSKLARIVLGSRFEWADLLAYTAGIATALLVEAARRRLPG